MIADLDESSGDFEDERDVKDRGRQGHRYDA